MLIEVYITLLLVTFGFFLLSVIPVGGRRSYQKWGEVFDSSFYAPLFAWLSMGLFFSLAVMSPNIELVHCDTIIQQIDTSVADIATYTNAWSCDTEQYISFELAWLFTGMGFLTMAYAVIITLIVMTGTLLETIENLR